MKPNFKVKSVAHQHLHHVLQLGRGTHWRLLSAVRCTAGAGGWKRDPRPSTAGEEDETAEEEHAAGEGQTHTNLKSEVFGFSV